MQGEVVALLHTELQQIDLGVPIAAAEIDGRIYGERTQAAVRVFQETFGLDPTGIVDAATARRINQEVDARKPYMVEGRVVSRSRAGVHRLRVEVVDKNVGGDVPLAEAWTDDAGLYRTAFAIADLTQRGKKKADLQARVFAGESLLGASDVRYDASNRETLNVLLTPQADRALASEHETLLADLGGQNLRSLQETEGQRDITYLASKTGWDARAVALAALADQFSARTADTPGATPIEPAFFYALFRAGLPANERVYRISAKAAADLWTQGIDQGVIPAALRDRIPQAVEQFQRLAARQALDGPALDGVSPLKEMLSISLGDDPARQQRFADLHVRHRDDPPRLWEAVRSEFGEAVERRLRVDGQLGYLTLNNAALIKRLHAAFGPAGLTTTLALAQEGYYRADKWHGLVTGGQLPPEIAGANDGEKRYAELLAAQVRLSFPTAAIAHMLKTGVLPLPGAAQSVVDQVHTFLNEHEGRFEIGLQPVERYVARNHLQVPSETIKYVKWIERLYQITPSDEALIGLIKRRVDAAYHVVRYDKHTFVQNFAADVGGEDAADLIYNRSVQVHHAVLNIALSYLIARTAPAIGVHSPAQVLDPAPAHAGDVIATATLESLFGSMDFCACDHCRSLLSPAAYLVDLLLFLDQPNPPAGTENPQAVLLARRPDIERLPLTCENTNTPLPYIDVVNETLEYFIANDVQKLTLDEYMGHDTGAAASADLLASPQFVMESAYALLREERFPVPLPFDQPLEALRRYSSKFDVPLALAMERLRKGDALERESNPYGWRDILMEEIGLSRGEYEILTDSTAVPLSRMYGFPTGTADADVVAGLSNAKAFARRVGVTYEDLVSLLKTRFINPNSDLIPRLERLGVSIAVLQALKDSSISDEQFDDQLPKGLAAPDPAAYAGDISKWVKDNDNYSRIMSLITLAVPAGTWAPSTPYSEGDLVRPTAPSPRSTLYYACTEDGISGATEPPWPEIPGESVIDGTVAWSYRDAANCQSFGDLAFRYSDPAKLTQNIGAAEFIRIARFIRLWKKLGWTIEDMDVAICALYRADLAPLEAGDADTLAKLDAGFLTLLPRLGIVFRVMRALNLKPKHALRSLLACWSDIDTHGDGSLYRQMFLDPTTLARDAVFADQGYSAFLQHVEVPYEHPQPTLEQPLLDAAQGKIAYNPTTKRLSYAGVLDAATRDALKAAPGTSPGFQQAVNALFAEQRLDTHREALRSAFNLTAEEHARIAAALGYNTDTPLTLSYISAIYRHGWLSRQLKISVRELLLLIRLTGLDPFAVPDPTNPALLRLIFFVQALKNRSLRTAAVLYLIWNEDLSGKSAPDRAQVASFARALRLAFAAVESDFAVTDDPEGAITEEQLAKVYGADVASFFSGLLNDTLSVEVEFSDPDGTMAPGAGREAIEQAAGETDAGVSRIAYDDFRKRLSFSGVLATATRDAIQLAAGPQAVAFQAAVDDPLDVNDLYDKSQAAVSGFFERYPELESSYNAYVADSIHSAAEKRRNLLTAILPELVQRRKRQQAIQSLSALAATDAVFTQALLDPDAAPFPIHAVGHTERPALDDVLRVGTPGLSVEYFASDTASGPVITAPDIVPNVDYSRAIDATGQSLPANPTPGAAISAVWRGYLEAPENGFFNLRIEADAGATVRLLWDDKAVELNQYPGLWINTKAIDVRAGRLYAIVLRVEKVRDVVRLQWEWESKGLGRAVIPPRYLYPAEPFQVFNDTYVRFLKAASLAAGLGLTGDELAHFAVQSYEDIDDGWLNTVAVNGDQPLSTPSALLRPFEALLDFARIKVEISPGTEALLTVLKDPATATQDVNSLLFTITRWNKESFEDVLGYVGGNTTALKQFDLFRRVYDALALVKKTGISAGTLIQAATNDVGGSIVRDFQAALRARYDTTSWRDVVRPINDEMRILQRDALVTYIFHQMRSHPESAHVDTPDKLFEYFLMDVQMDACMQTSRIRHALSSVQLFVERCLMNLEPRVSPAAINAEQWEWMKRYRVWEAIRKVFFWPENYLELRDDQSPFFKGVLSELLQADITEDRAATALLNYLTKLAEVAKLEPCGIYHVEGDPTKRTPSTDHVVGRSAGKYYYRRREGRSWGPWEEIKLDIEGKPVMPVVWKGRLFLFWLKILPTSPPEPPPPIPPGQKLKDVDASAAIKSELPKVKVQAILCWSEYYNGTWQSAKTSDVNRPTTLFGQIDPDSSAPNGFDRSECGLEAWVEQGSLRVVITGPGGGSSFLLYNTHSLPVRREEAPTPGTSSTTGSRDLDTSSDRLIVFYFKHLDFDPSLTRVVLRNVSDDSAIQPAHALQRVWHAPFFYEDGRHVFYVTTETMQVPVHSWDGFGFATPTQISSSHMASLVLEEAMMVKPTFQRDLSPQRAAVGTNAKVVQRLVTEDTYINKAIGTVGSIRYGDSSIGIRGGLVREGQNQ
jgi:hypothetical protein